MFHYVSFRAILALVLSLLMSMWMGGKFIAYMKSRKHIEAARDAETDPYGVQKKGVPSMGGVVIVAAIVIPALLLCQLDNIYVILLIITALWLTTTRRLHG